MPLICEAVVKQTLKEVEGALVYTLQCKVIWGIFANLAGKVEVFGSSLTVLVVSLFPIRALSEKGEKLKMEHTWPTLPLFAMPQPAEKMKVKKKVKTDAALDEWACDIRIFVMFILFAPCANTR